MMKKVELEIKNPHAAGIDIGSRSHFVAVGQRDDQVQEFGISHSSHLSIIKFLKENGITSVAMESTGSYWQPLYMELADAGFKVLLVPGTQTKGFRKTDVKDARQLQQLHALGILSSCFLPDSFTNKVRELCRYRKSLIGNSAQQVNRMQKCLRLMNIRLDVLLSDITGKSGRRIIEAIIAGNRQPEFLASLADRRVKKSKQQLADALIGNYKEELLYELRDCYDMFSYIEAKIDNLDAEIERYYKEFLMPTDIPEGVELATKQLKGKNQPQFSVQEIAYNMYGVDISKIDGVSVNTMLSIISEVGLSIYHFADAKSFVSWLRLCPNNKISGGRKISGRTPRGKNFLAEALRNAANSIGNQKKGYLAAYFRRIGLRKGRLVAITATARKLATIIFNMITRNEEYNEALAKSYQLVVEERRLSHAIKLLKDSKYNIIDNQGVVV